MTLRPRLNRQICLTLLAITIFAFLFYFPIAGIRAANSASVVPSIGTPLVHLMTPQAFSPTYTGTHDVVSGLKSGHATAMAMADFDADGAMDVATGYSIAGGGAIAILHGNPDALAPRDTSLYAKALSGSIPLTFQSKAAVFSLPVSPDFMVTGDFDQDGHKDLLAAAWNGALYFMKGDGKGNLAKAQLVPLVGGVTALSAIADGHVAVGTDGAGGSQVVILAPGHSGISSIGTFPLTAPAASIAWGALGQHTGPDLAIAAGDNVVVIYHAFHDDAQTETVNVPFKIDALSVADFIWDRDGRTEIALLADDGSIHILQHGTLDTTPYTAAELKARGSLRAAIRAAKTTSQASTTSIGPWTLATTLASSVSATSGAGRSMMQSPRLTGAADLLLMDAGKSQLKIVDGTGKAATPETDIAFSSQPVAAVVTPQKLNGKRDVVVLTAGSITPTIISEDSSGIDPTVNSTADSDPQNACGDTSILVGNLTGTITLREALCAASNSYNAKQTGLVTITLPTGTYTLTSLDTGELQVGYNGANVALVGAGAVSTIIQQGDGVDRVFDIDPNAGGNATMSISNVTIQNGTNDDANDLSVDGGGGMIDGSGTTSPDNLTLTNVILTNNTNNGSGASFGGGGLAFEGVGSLTVTNSTISNNTANEETGGGIETGNENSGAGDSFTFTNDIFTGNESTTDGSDGGEGGGLLLATAEGNTASISGSTFTNNTAQNASASDPGLGGAINNAGPDGGTFTITNSRITGNSAGSGSGLITDDTTATVIDNWWGCNGGPGATGCDTVVETGTGTTTFNPWLVLSISANPTQVHTSTGTSALTANLTQDSNGNSGFSVPNGTPLSFGATLGTISGASTTLTSGQGTATFNAGATPGSGSASATVDNQTVSVTITVGAPPTITSGNSTTFIVGTAGSFSVTTTGDPTPSLSESGALPSGVTFVDNGNGTASLSGTPAAGSGGVYSFTITAQNGFSPNATQSFTLTVDQAPAITSANNTTFTLNTAGTFTVTTTGFPTAALSESGTLPAGVGFVDNGNGTGTLSGTPTQGGIFNITFTASNGVSPNAVQSFTLTVGQAPTITSANNTTFIVGTAGSFTVTTTGTPTPSLTESGALPAGVSFVDNHNGTATLSGTPSTGGTFSITITAANGVGSNAVQSFTLTVNQAPAITSTNNTTFVVGTAGSFTVTTTGFPTPSLSESGTLPTGVSFVDNHNGTGTLSGTPTSSGTFNITFTAANGVGSNAVQSFTLNVPPSLSFTSANNTTFVYGTASTFTVTTTGTPVPTLTESGVLPSGIRFFDNHNGTGSLTGTPLTKGIFNITFTASNGAATVAQNFTLTVDRAPFIVSPNNATFKFEGSSAFEVATGGFPTPSITESGTLPIGITFVDNGNGTGKLSGIATTSGTYPIIFTASNGVGSPAMQEFTLTVAGPVVSLSPTSINFGTVYKSTTTIQTIMVTNIGTTDLNITNLAFKIGPGDEDDDFTYNNQCPPSIGPGDTCNIQVIFFAGDAGMISAALHITDNAPGSPQNVPLSATVINPVPLFQPSSLSFGTVKHGQSKTLVVTLTNIGSSLLDISNIGITGADPNDFTTTTDCQSQLGGGHNCKINVTFTPQATGSRTAFLTVVDNAQNGTQNIPLAGTGD